MTVSDILLNVTRATSMKRLVLDQKKNLSDIELWLSALLDLLRDSFRICQTSPKNEIILWRSAGDLAVTDAWFECCRDVCGDQRKITYAMNI